MCKLCEEAATTAADDAVATKAEMDAVVASLKESRKEAQEHFNAFVIAADMFGQRVAVTCAVNALKDVSQQDVANFAVIMMFRLYAISLVDRDVMAGMTKLANAMLGKEQ